MLKPENAMLLRQLFTAEAGTYPRLTGTADLFFTSRDESSYRVETRTPRATAAHLRHIADGDGTGIFDRTNRWGGVNALHLRMNKQVRSPTLNKEWMTQAFIFAWRELDRPAFMWLSDPGTTDYSWQGEEKVENRAPIVGDGPTLADMIGTFHRAGDNWQAVNFISRTTRLHHPHLKLVQNL